MKKITTLLLASATVATASAFNFNHNELEASTIARYATPIAVSTQDAEVELKKVGNLSVASRGYEEIDIEGDWIAFTTSSGYISGTASAYKIAKSGSEYTVSNLWRNYYTDVTQQGTTLLKKDIELSDGSYLPGIAIPGSSKVGYITFEDGSKADLIISLVNLTSGSIYTKNDIEFLTAVDNSTGEEYMLFAYTNEDIDVAIAYKDEATGQFNIIDYDHVGELIRPNAVLKAENMQNFETKLGDVTIPVYILVDDYEGDRYVDIANFAEYNGLPEGVVVDEGTKIEFFMQSAGTLPKGSGSYYDVLLLGFEGDEGVNDVVGTYSEVNGDVVIEIPEVVMYTTEIERIWKYYKNVVIAQGDAAGISNVAADIDNSNAPIVYYNLQGQLVKEPAAGQIVIRRQGTEVTKLIMK